MADEELTAEQLAEQIRRIGVGDIVLSTASTLAQLGFAKLAGEEPDLEQAQLAIEALGALVPILERGSGEDVGRDFRQVVANLQLAYAEAASASPPPEEGAVEAEESGDAM